MTDEVYEFIQDCREKKSTARSARNKRTHNGKSGRVRFPSDNLTKKEREAMNGECKTYRLNDPMDYQDFKELPNDLKEVYLNSIIQTYNTPISVLSVAMGMEKSTLSWLIKKYKLKVNINPKRSHAAWDQAGFYNWWNGHNSIKKDMDELDEAVDEYFDNEGSTQERLPDICTNPYHYMPVIPKSGTMTFEHNNADDALATIKALLSNIKVNITVSWESVNEDSTCACPIDM